MEDSNMMLSGDMNKIYTEVNRVAEGIMVQVRELQERVKTLEEEKESAKTPKVNKKIDKAA
jgi:hypothetical protein|tara:strand:- start:765 stop:947 length:183 start_codon:yes stop_codon:yes gene_type:complete